MDFKYANMHIPKRRQNNVFNIFVKNSLESLSEIERAVSEMQQQDDLERIIHLD